MLKCWLLHHLLVKNSGMMMSGQAKGPFWPCSLLEAVESHRMMELQDHRIIQAGRDLRRPLVQRPAHRRVSSEVRLGCSGLHPVRAWKSPGTKNAKPVPLPDCSFGGKSFSLYQRWTSPASVNGHCPLSSDPTRLWWPQLHTLDDLHIGTGGCC